RGPTPGASHSSATGSSGCAAGAGPRAGPACPSTTRCSATRTSPTPGATGRPGSAGCGGGTEAGGGARGNGPRLDRAADPAQLHARPREPPEVTMPRATPLHPRLIAAALLLASVTAASAQDVAIVLDTAITTEHTVTIKGQRVPYRATAGNQPVWDANGKPIASVFYVYYERSDVRDRTTRPLVISFNGGPGSASVWMHIGYTGPRFVAVDDEGFPIQPYGVRENPHSILDVADIVYVDPVNTGFSRIVGGADRSQFFGVNEDIAYLARWIDTFVSRRGRWTSPKFLIGESYGTTRVAGLVRRLQSSHWMFFNGVILVSPTGLGIARDG